MSELAKQGTTQDQTCPPCQHGNHDWCRKPIKVGGEGRGEGRTHWIAICCCGGQPSKLKKVAPAIGLPKGPSEGPLSKKLDSAIKQWEAIWEEDKRKKQLAAFEADRERRRTGIIDFNSTRLWALRTGRLRKTGGDSDGQRQ